jgi:hypothetical protein
MRTNREPPYRVARAQETLGAITGTVKDNSGAVVADATVKARSLATNQENDAALGWERLLVGAKPADRHV